MKMFLSLLAAGSFCVVAPAQAQTESTKTSGNQGATKQTTGKSNKQGAATSNKAADKSGKAGAKASASEQKLEVTLGSMGVSPTKFDVSAGPVVLDITNTSDKPHKMVLEGGTMKKVEGNVSVGGTGQITADLAPGSYRLSCQMSGHTESGAKLTVK